MVNYSRGKIYGLGCNITDEMYVGSTCKKYLSQRVAEHRKNHRKGLSGTANRIIARGNYTCTLLESYPCQNIDELRARERYWIENTPNTVNKQIPGRTKKEYNKQYCQDNKEKIKEYRKEYNSTKATCECGCQVSKEGLARHKRTQKHIDRMKSINK